MNNPKKPYTYKRVSAILGELRLHFTNTSVKEKLKRSDFTTEIDSESLKQILQGYWKPKKSPMFLQDIFKKIFKTGV